MLSINCLACLSLTFSLSKNSLLGIKCNSLKTYPCASKVLKIFSAPLKFLLFYLLLGFLIKFYKGIQFFSKVTSLDKSNKFGGFIT